MRCSQQYLYIIYLKAIQFCYFSEILQKDPSKGNAKDTDVLQWGGGGGGEGRGGREAGRRSELLTWIKIFT